MVNPENVSEDQLKSYIGTFHSALKDTADKYLPTEFRDKLLHSSLLPAKIKCYVSTKFGVGFEYIPASKNSIETVRGSSRIEELFFGTPRKLSKTPPLFNIVGVGTLLRWCSFKGDRFPIRLANENASATVSNTKFEASDWTRDVFFGEIYGNRKFDEWTDSKAVIRAQNEVLMALTEINRSKDLKIPVHEYLSQQKEKTVLLLGKYGGEGGVRLAMIKNALVGLGYNPVMTKDVPDHPHHTLDQTVTALGSAARFVVIDDTEVSGHNAELPICKQNDWVTIILHESGRRSSLMTASFTVGTTIRKDFKYEKSNISKAIKESTQWAEAELIATERKLNSTYPWRSKQ